jgi:hypothetical protein
MVLSDEARHTKLARLAELEGIDVDELLAAATFDSISPAICVNESCDYTSEMEPDQDAGWCEVCSTNSVQSALILAGLI